jgi:serine/threonine-protein kinase RsbW
MKERMLVIPSIPSQISEVESYLNRIIEKLKIDTERYPDILISLTEAVNNAIIHGNKGDQKKVVKIEMQEEHKTIKFIVSDEGLGFSIDNIPDPTCAENIECCGGRGVLIMSSLCDEINFQNNGSTVEMSFQIQR